MNCYLISKVWISKGFPFVWDVKHCWAKGKPFDYIRLFLPGFGYGIPIYWALGKGDGA